VNAAIGLMFSVNEREAIPPDYHWHM